jgi:hypothetical protein
MLKMNLLDGATFKYGIGEQLTTLQQAGLDQATKHYGAATAVGVQNDSRSNTCRCSDNLNNNWQN